MQKITQQELLYLAHLSRLQLSHDEVLSLISPINEVLEYALRVKDIVQLHGAQELAAEKNCNVFREDIIIKTDSEPLLNQAPESEQNYFVVPMILETT